MMKPFRQPFSCLLSFYFGMLLFRDRKLLKSNGIFLLSEAVFLLLLFWHLPLPEVVTAHLAGFSGFIVLFRLGAVFTRHPGLCLCFEKLGRLSYPVFLLQHVIIMEVLRRYDPTETLPYLLLLCVTTIGIFAAAWLLSLVQRLLAGIPRAVCKRIFG